MTLRSADSGSFLKPLASMASTSSLQGEKKKSNKLLKNIASSMGMRKRKRRNIQSTSNLTPTIEDEAFELEHGNAEEDDTISVDSLEVFMSPDVKRKRGLNSSLSRVTSLASVLSTPMSKVGQVLHRSVSSAKLPPPNSPAPSAGPSTEPRKFSTPTKFFSRSISHVHMSAPGVRAPDSPFGQLRRGGSGRGSTVQLTPYKPPQPTPNKQRPTRYWSSQFPESCKQLKSKEIKLQEAIYEIACGEEDLVEDLRLLEKTYADSLKHLSILSETEVELVFGKLKDLPPLHITLYRALRELRSPQTGISQPIGNVLLDWVSRIGDSYVNYCASLVEVKAFLDERMERDKDFSDFLQRCLESPFSRKLDLWSYLDVPRSRLVKYPLLMKQVLKFSDNSSDAEKLAEAIHDMEKVLRNVDRAMAQGRCRFTVSRLEWLDESLVKMGPVQEASEEILDGILRNNRGTKLECHLMDTVLILGRPSTHGTGGVKKLQVYRTPIPVCDLVVEDLDGNHSHGSGSSTGSASSSLGGGRHGSFKSAFTNSQSVKNSFRVSFREGTIAKYNPVSKGQTSHTLTAKDEHSKRQWILTIQKTIDTLVNKNRQFESIKEEPDSSGSWRKIRSNSRIISKAASSRVALFQKNKRSPRIKSSLSYAAIEQLKKGGGAKKIKTFHSAARLSATTTPSNLPPSEPENETPLSRASVRTQPKIVQRGFKKSVNASQERKVLKESGNLVCRGRTKSWSHLIQEKSNSNSSTTTPRYLTRSKAKISKSLSDLLQM